MLLPVTFLKFTSFGQNASYDLLTEPYVKRPVSMHLGQLEVVTAYNMSISGLYYEYDGNPTDIQENGTAVIGHRGFFKVRYGLLENIELAAETNYFRQGMRSTTLNYNDPYEFVTISSLKEYRGLEDLLLSGTLRIPSTPGFFDFGLNAFLSLPLAKHNPDKPEHTVEYTFLDYWFTTINKKETFRNGKGVIFYGLGAELKLHSEKLAVYGSATCLAPVAEGTGLYWDSYLMDGIFHYNSVEYNYFPSSILKYHTEVHYQFNGWFNLFAGYSGMDENYGWFERANLKFEYPRIKLSRLITGYEIQVSPAIRLVQILEFPLSGMNSYSSFTIHTGLNINMFTR